MSIDEGLRVQFVPGSADEGCQVYAPRPPEPGPWSCDRDGHLNNEKARNCAYCGRFREDVER